MKSISLGAIVAIVTVTVITIVGELYAPFKDWLKSVFTHHWLGKSALAVMVFVLVSFISYPLVSDEEKPTERFLRTLFYVALFSTLVLVIFFYLHGR